VNAEGLVRPVVEGAGLELVEVVYGREGGRRILRVTLDSDGGLDLDTIADVSEKVSRRLDLDGFGREPYELEVSSPGIERPLRTAAQFGRFVGAQVNVKTAGPIEGARVHAGALVAADDLAVTVRVAGAERRIPLAEIVSARTVADWDAELKGSKA
jgi:ribosome maturation factor RimP